VTTSSFISTVAPGVAVALSPVAELLVMSTSLVRDPNPKWIDTAQALRNRQRTRRSRTKLTRGWTTVRFCECARIFHDTCTSCRTCWIPLSDDARLTARIWLPEDADDDPVPAILDYIP
jgi:hypothetical protein